MSRVKICGINSDAAMDAACEAGADWVGFVFVKGSPRAVSPARAEALSARCRGGPLRVGLFVEPTDDAVVEALEAVPFDVVQLYAAPERVAEIRAMFGVTVWRSVPARELADLPAAADGADGFVIEPPPPAGAGLPGGNATLLDPGFLRRWEAPVPWLLAGGLTPATVGAAIAASGATAVDVSSGVESARGVKDPGLIWAFVAAARGVVAE